MMWLDKLKQGDTVIVYHKDIFYLDIVDKVEGDYIYVSYDKYNKSDGMEVTFMDNKARLRQPKPELIKRIRDKQKHNELVDRLTNTPWRDQSLDKLKVICKILDE